MPPPDCAAGQRQVGEVLGQRARRLRLEFELPERHGRAAHKIKPFDKKRTMAGTSSQGLFSSCYFEVRPSTYATVRRRGRSATNGGGSRL